MNTARMEIQNDGVYLSIFIKGELHESISVIGDRLIFTRKTWRRLIIEDGLSHTETNEVLLEIDKIIGFYK